MANEENKNEETKTDRAAIALTTGGMELTSVDDMWRAAQMFVGSQLCPKGLDSPNKVIVALQAGAELGLLPWQSLQSLYVVNGRVGLSGQTMVALIRKHRVSEYLDMSFEGEPFKDGFKAIVRSKRRDEPIEHLTDYSVADAKQAKLWGSAKDNWAKFPKDMLTWRAVSRHARFYYPDVITGFYTEEEIQSMVPAGSPMDLATEPGVEGFTKRVEAQQKDVAPDEPTADEPKEPEKPKERGRKTKLVDWFCPACGRGYQYGATAGKGVACECGKSNIRRKPDVEEQQTAETAEAPEEKEVESADMVSEAPKEGVQAGPWKCQICSKDIAKLNDKGQCPYCFSAKVVEK